MNKKSQPENQVPRHVAIIMDGNGRWAKRRGLPRSAGHARGAERFRKIATACKELGVEFLTVYAFSTENWKRPPDEVRSIIDLLRRYLRESVETMERDGVRLRFLGDLSVLPDDVLELIRQTDEITQRTQGMLVSVCFNYGARDELRRAAVKLMERVKDGTLKPSELTEELISGALDSACIPDPDLVIRPSGEYRLSNFLLWQSAYAELYFTDTLWPDFDKTALIKAFCEYSERTRRFGGL